MLDMTKINIDPTSVSPESRNAATLRQRPEYYLMVTANNALKEGNISPLQFIAREFADTNGHRSAIVNRYIGIVNAKTLEDLEEHRKVIEGFMSNTEYDNSINEVSMADLVGDSDEFVREIAALYRIPYNEAVIEARKMLNPEVPKEIKEEEKPEEEKPEAQKKKKKVIVQEEKEEVKDMTLKKKKPATAVGAKQIGTGAKKPAAAPVKTREEKELEAKRARIQKKREQARLKKQQEEEEELARQQQEEEEEFGQEAIDEVLEFVETNSNKVLHEMSQFPLVISRDPELALMWAELMNGAVDFIVKAQELREKYDAFVELSSQATDDKFVEDEEAEPEEDYEEDEE